ncbi:hypothetical protein ACQ4M3_39545 [Leptolyngbya sp. AN03gr2]|uniref:hypothetical protein n=1 Tax=unclassified Leptolyngbya TaxID=2650499 RepID=UPI003D323997
MATKKATKTIDQSVTKCLPTATNERALLMQIQVEQGKYELVRLHQKECAFDANSLSEICDYDSDADPYWGSKLFVDPLSLRHAKLVIVDLGEIGYFDCQNRQKFQPYPIRRNSENRVVIPPSRKFSLDNRLRNSECFLRDRIFSPQLNNFPIVGMSLDYAQYSTTTGIRNRPCFGLKVRCQVLLLVGYDESIDHKYHHISFEEFPFGIDESYFQRDRVGEGYRFAESSFAR